MTYQRTKAEIKFNMIGFEDTPLVRWVRKDDASQLTMKSGKFEHTITDSDTWATIKAAIRTKIDADEGMEV